MKLVVLFTLFLSTTFLYAETNKQHKYSLLEKFLIKSNNVNSINSTKLNQNISSNYLTRIYNSENRIYTKNRNIRISKRNLNLIIDSKKNNSRKSSSKNDFITLTIEAQFRLFDYINVKSKTCAKLSKNDEYLVSLDYKKTWKNIYYIDCTIGQNFLESFANKFNSKHFIKFDKKLNEYYSLHNYYEYNLQMSNENIENIHSSISLKQKLDNDESLIYKVVLNSDEENSSYGINVKYKLSNIFL